MPLNFKLGQSGPGLTTQISQFLIRSALQGRPLTTRARWLNPFIFTQFSIVKRFPQLKRVEKPIFIVGTGRSGTTILGEALSTHPQLAFLNEPKGLWYAVKPEDDVIGSYSSKGKGRYRLSSSDATPQVIQDARRLYGYSLFVSGASRILDKYPEMIFRASFLQRIFPDAKFIFLVRSGWDTALSIAKWSKNARVEINGETHDWWGADQLKWQMLLRDIVCQDPELAGKIDEIASFEQQEQMAAVEWLVTMREGIRLVETEPDSVYQLKYEELVAEPEATLSQILEFCELPPNAFLLDYARTTLKPRPPKTPFDIHPAVRTLFHETMEHLDYI